MYDKLSYGIHNLSDDECTKIADEILYVFDELLVGLKERIDKELEFKQRMKALEVPARKS
jgi:hypothetical protein